MAYIHKRCIASNTGTVIYHINIKWAHINIIIWPDILRYDSSYQYISLFYLRLDNNVTDHTL